MASDEKPRVPTKVFKFTESRFWQKKSYRDKDLLVIEENKRPSSKVTYARNGGDWFAHNNNDSPPQKVSQKPPPIQTAPTKPAPKPAIQFGALPGGEEQQPRTGKKRFEQQRRDAPFATNW